MAKTKSPILYIVIPCYNEEKTLPITKDLFINKLKDLIKGKAVNSKSRILFVNDGSRDKTWQIIKDLSSEYEIIEGISLSRNRGHQNALLAGLLEARALSDITVSIDCDGQDDINAINQMIDEYKKGSDIVYGVRSSRKKDTFFKRFTAETFYKLLSLMGAEVIYNHADYRLVSSKVLNEFQNFNEVNLFLRGMFPLVGFNSSVVYYERKNRIAGESHYPISKMLGLAFDGITSLSIKPIRLITTFGTIVAFASFCGVVWTIVRALSGNTVSGWASTTCIVCFVSGVQLISLGIIGEYVGKTYLESKHRPRYIVSQRTFKKI